MKNISTWLYSLLIALMTTACAAKEAPLTMTVIPPADAWGPETTTVTLPKRTHPFLFLNEADFSALRNRASSKDWSKPYNQLIKEADAALAHPLEIPDKAGEWSHHYVCKVCGIDLEEQKGKNVCPRCRREYTGWPFDGVVAGRHHHRNIDDAKSLGLAYQLTGKTAYADRCREILLGYADRYNQWPIHDYKGTQIVRGARLFAQTLDESVGMIPMIWAYDLIYNAPGTTAEQRAHLENDLFRPAALVIRRNDMSISNWQSWHNAAMAAIGFTLEDPAMVNHAVNGKSGIHFQMKHSILPDGFWYEGTASYHFYALEALQWQAQSMKNASINLYEDPGFESLYKAPLDYAFPDGTFPVVNDSDQLSIKDQAEYYEMAYSWYHLPEFAAVARAGGRNSLSAFLWGADTLPDAALNHGVSRTFPGLGAVMLRQDGNAKIPTALHLDYGPHGGAHGHFDKLGIIYFADGRDIMPDPGRLAYGAPLHKNWYMTSLAHNTIIVDGKNQAATEGKLLSTDLDGPIKLATASCNTAYQGVELTRSVALAPEYLLDVASGTSQKSHTWDLACHVYGKPTTDLPLIPATLAEKTDGYQVLKNIRAAQVSGKPWSIRVDGGGRGNRQIGLFQADTGPRQVILADGFSGGDVTTCPVVLSRQTGMNPIWITLTSPDTKVQMGIVCQKTVDGWSVEIKVGKRVDRYSVKGGVLTLEK